MSWPINVILRLLKAVDFVVVVANVFVVVVVVNVIVVALLVVTGHNIQLLSININLRLLKATFEFLWRVGGGVVHNHFKLKSNYSVEIVLCCCWGSDKNVIFLADFHHSNKIERLPPFLLPFLLFT